jgi:hypothetical protein
MNHAKNAHVLDICQTVISYICKSLLYTNLTCRWFQFKIDIYVYLYIFLNP